MGPGGYEQWHGAERKLKLPSLIPGVLLRRYKRFLADVVLQDGRRITAHCPNTGAMTGCAEPDWPVWLSTSDNPRRKYAHTWELVQTPHGYVSVNTGRANHLVGEAIRDGLIASLGDVCEIRPEVRIPEGDGRFDFLVRTGADADDPGNLVYIEVKSVTLHTEDGEGAFPDAVSSRALKHVQALCKRVAEGNRAMLVFCAQHTGIQRVRTAAEIDPAYADAVQAAIAAGVEVVALGSSTDLHNMQLDRVLPFS